LREGDAELMTAWVSARDPSLRSGQVVLGPFRSKAEPEVETPGMVKPAA